MVHIHVLRTGPIVSAIIITNLGQKNILLVNVLQAFCGNSFLFFFTIYGWKTFYKNLCPIKVFNKALQCVYGGSFLLYRSLFLILIFICSELSPAEVLYFEGCLSVTIYPSYHLSIGDVSRNCSSFGSYLVIIYVVVS